MISASRSSAITSRENHSHGAPTRRNSVRYFSFDGACQRTSAKGDVFIGRGAGFLSISSDVTIVAI